MGGVQNHFLRAGFDRAHDLLFSCFWVSRSSDFRFCFDALFSHSSPFSGTRNSSLFLYSCEDEIPRMACLGISCSAAFSRNLDRSPFSTHYLFKLFSFFRPYSTLASAGMETQAGVQGQLAVTLPITPSVENKITSVDKTKSNAENRDEPFIVIHSSASLSKRCTQNNQSKFMIYNYF